MRSLYACVFCVLVACGGSESQCDSIVEVMCDRAVECDVGGWSNVGECKEEVAKANKCSSDDKIDGDLDTCLDDMEAASCNALFPSTPVGRMFSAPASCYGEDEED